MIREYALDPAVPAHSVDRCRYFLGMFGVDRGRVIACFPKRWKRLVYDAVSERLNQGAIGNVERSSIENLLQRLPKGVLFPSRRIYPEGVAAWLDAAIRAHGQLPFAAIISNYADARCADVVAQDCVSDTDVRFCPSPQRIIPRSPEKIVGAVQLLLRAAKTIKLIDPHMKASEPRWRYMLQTLFREVGPDAIVEIHRIDDGDRNVQSWFTCLEAMRGRLAPVRVYTHQRHLMHNRFILTELGGASYGTGLDDNDGGTADSTAHDDVFLLTDGVWSQHWSEYSSDGAPILDIPRRNG